MELNTEQLKKYGEGMVHQCLIASMILTKEAEADGMPPLFDMENQDEVYLFRESFKAGYIAAARVLGISQADIIKAVQFSELEIDSMAQDVDSKGCFCGQCNKEKR